MRPTAVALIGFAIILGACGSSDKESEPAAPAAAPTTTTSAGEKAAALEGTWRTDPITVGDTAETLREARLAKWVGGFKRNAPISDVPTALILEIREGAWDLYGQPQGGQRQEIDYDAEYEVDGDTVVVSHEGDSNTYRWSVSDDVLKLTWLKTTYGAHEGIPEEVFQRALYMTADFRRTP
jgi:hypothetical protein